jgi:hypothetical protein
MRYGRRSCAAAAVLAASALLGACSGSDESASDEEDSASTSGDLALPDELGDLSLMEAQCDSAGDSKDQCLENADNIGAVVDASADNLSQAYDGAESVGEAYTSTDLQQNVKVLAVAASSPGLWTSDSDVQAKYTRLGHPQEWVEERDGAQCLARTLTTVREGEPLSPANVVPTRCQATGADLTVILLPAPDTSLDDALALTHEAFEAVG